jgi:Tfp pilus assembly protein PilX
MRRLAREEGGWALVTAIVLMTLMATFALATSATVDNQQKQSAVGRQRETAFNLGEAALNAQIYALTTHWTGPGGAINTAVAAPQSCTPASSDNRCPNASALSALFSSADTDTGSTWKTMVRDNSGVTGAASFWSDTMITAAPRYDANGDGKVWVRASGVSRGHSRAMVALVRTEQQPESLPHDTLLAGRVSISNNGNKVIIDTKGNQATSGAVTVRCTPQASESQTCLGHSLGNGANAQSQLTSLLNTQIYPNVSTTGYAGGSGLAPDALERLRLSAIANGTYYTSCPTSLTGALVWIDTTNTCSYTGNVVYNASGAAGVVIMARGTLSIAGTVQFYGVIYHANMDNSTTWPVQLGGNAQVFGGVLIDGNAGLVAGSSKTNVVFDDSAFAAVRSYGTAGLIQNTWREIKGATS